MNISKLGQFFQDGDGMLSATRLGFLLTLFSVLFMWLFTCYTQSQLLPIDQSLLYLIGILMGGKTLQSFSENSTPPK
jgi:hypothetical protein